MFDPKLKEALGRVQKPGRYTGGEPGSIYKEKDKVDVRFAFCFPDTYEVGMSFLGEKILYELLNSHENWWCERAFMPWLDMKAEMERLQLPLYTMESKDPLTVFDAVGFTLQYELSYTNILAMLDLAGIPFYSKDRDDRWPLIVAGGPCACNAEPIADFFDVIQLGEGENQLPAICAEIEKAKKEGISKKQLLLNIAKIPGVYIPAFYDVTYHEDGRVKAITPNEPGIPARITKAIIKDLNQFAPPTNFVVPMVGAIQDRASIEVLRGCVRGCRFCQAGFVYRPVRTRSEDLLVKYGIEACQDSGYQDMTLMSLSSSDYPDLLSLCDGLLEWCEPHKVNLALPSLRADNFSMNLMEKLQRGGRKSGLTLAPEAGSQRLRDAINKNVTEEDLLNSCRTAFSGGWSSVKLYFMLGLPTETDEDVLGIADLAQKVYHVWRENTPNRSRGVRITVSTSCFVPKSHTPFQWEAQNTQEEYLRKVTLLREHMRNKSITYNWHDPETSYLEAVLSRGDRRIADVIEEAWRHGAKFDSWSEYFNLQTWLTAMETCGVSPAFYANRVREKDEILPWHVISDGVKESYLWRERETAYAGKITPDCKVKCSGCGADKLCKGGICHG